MIDGGEDLLRGQQIPDQRLMRDLRDGRLLEANLWIGVRRDLVGVRAQRVDRVGQQDARDERQEAPFTPAEHDRVGVGELCWEIGGSLEVGEMVGG